MAKEKKFDELNNVFNVDPIPVETPAEIQKVDVVVDTVSTSRLDQDISYVFGMLKSTIEKSNEALDGALELAQETESSRAYEVVGQLVKQTVDSAEKIIDIHKKLKEMESGKNLSQNVTQNNAVFVGTTAEAIKLLKAQINEQ
jgi:membrane glycosyltransferase